MSGDHLVNSVVVEVVTDIRSHGAVLTISLDMKDWILVTGGAGYVGSHCVLQILQSGHNVVILDNLSNSSRGQLVVRRFPDLFHL